MYKTWKKLLFQLYRTTTSTKLLSTHRAACVKTQSLVIGSRNTKQPTLKPEVTQTPWAIQPQTISQKAPVCAKSGTNSATFQGK